jgi:endoglucanase
MKTSTFAVIATALTLTSGATASAALPLVGTSLSGGEWNVTTYGVNRGGYHVYPDAHYVAGGYDSPATFAKAGMTIFRFPIDWENVQPTLGQPFDQAEFEKVTTTVSDLTALGVTVLIDLHNYGRYDGNTVGSGSVPNSAFADFWSRMAKVYAGNSQVAFDLMNEPHDMPTEQWASAANAAIAAIRSAGAKNLVFVEGNGWAGAAGWVQNWYGTPDATVMLTITDPANNYVFEAHQYLDPQSTGGGDTCDSATIGSERVKPFTDWLRQNGKRGFLGEFNGGTNATCYAALADLFNHLEANADVYLGWTWWASGPEWGSSLRVLEPGRDDYASYMQVIQPHLHAAGSVVPPAADGGTKNETGTPSGDAASDSATTGASSGGNNDNIVAQDASGGGEAASSPSSPDAGPRVLGATDSGSGGGCSASASPSPSRADGYALGVLALGLAAGSRRRRIAKSKSS